jgi:hypothetical protein
MTIRGLVRVNQSNENFRNDSTSDRTKLIAACTDISFAKNVVPKRSLTAPTRGRNADLLRRERSDPYITRYGLARGQPDTLSALQIAHSKRMIGLNLALTRNGQRATQ